MITTEWYIIGSLTMPSTWISALLAMVFTAIALWLSYNKHVASRVIDYFITFILSWKFSVLLTDFTTVLKQPLSILYFNGGMVGVVLATIIVLYMIIRDKKLNALIFAQLISYIFGFYSITMVILNENTLTSELITLSSAIVLLIISWYASKFKSLIYYLLVSGGMIFFFSILQPLGVSNVMLWWAIGMIVIAFILSKWMMRKELLHD